MREKTWTFDTSQALRSLSKLRQPLKQSFIVVTRCVSHRLRSASKSLHAIPDNPSVAATIGVRVGLGVGAGVGAGVGGGRSVVVGEVGSVPRSQGKAVRVVDRRGEG